jgi:hypothetical protein
MTMRKMKMRDRLKRLGNKVLLLEDMYFTVGYRKLLTGNSMVEATRLQLL